MSVRSSIRWVGFSFVGTCFLIGTLVYAQTVEDPPAVAAGDSGAPESNDQTVDAQTKTESDSTPEEPTKKNRTKDPREIFRPSEEISEDFAVPFPVDI